MSDRGALELLVDLFEHPGWDVFVENVRSKREELASSLLSVKPEDLRSTQAEIRRLDWLLGLPDDARRQYQRAGKRASEEEAQEGG